MTDLTFIAGGSKGLGSELVNIFSQHNHLVLEFSRSGQGDHHIACDFSNSQACIETIKNTFAKHTTNKLNSVNLLINTAIIAPFGPIAKADHHSIRNHLMINVESTLLLLREFLAAFHDHAIEKSITYISSGASRRAIPGMAIYSASKAFFDRYMDTLAEEQSNEPHPFQCMTINPGVMNTGMQVEIRAQNAEDFPMVDMWHEFHEKGQLADPKDIAEVCYRLISKEGENGGYYTAQGYLPY